MYEEKCQKHLGHDLAVSTLKTFVSGNHLMHTQKNMLN